MHQYQLGGNPDEALNDYILPLCEATINGVTSYFLALFKAARLSIKIFLSSRLPHPTETCSGVESSVSVNIREIPLSSNNLILSTLSDAETK